MTERAAAAMPESRLGSLDLDRLSTPISIFVLAFLWEIAGRLSGAFLFPPLSAVFGAWWELTTSGVLLPAISISIQALFIGFGFAVLIGIVLGTAMGLSPTIKALFDLYVNTLMAAPLIALVPIIATFLGLDLQARAFIVFLFAFFNIVLNTEAGMNAVSPEITEMAKSFRLSRGQVFRLITLPAAMPAIFSGIRLGMVRAIKGMVIAEMFMALTGMGALLDFYGSQFQAEELFAVLLTLIAFSMAVGGLMTLIDRRVTRWQIGIAN